MQKLGENFNPCTLPGLMCRSMISVDWDGFLYDCDFNQMLGFPLGGKQARHLSELLTVNLENQPIFIADHCYGCTAGNGSSCGGALRG